MEEPRQLTEKLVEFEISYYALSIACKYTQIFSLCTGVWSAKLTGACVSIE
jgi:hypothetical protein